MTQSTLAGLVGDDWDKPLPPWHRALVQSFESGDKSHRVRNFGKSVALKLAIDFALDSGMCEEVFPNGEDEPAYGNRYFRVKTTPPLLTLKQQAD